MLDRLVNLDDSVVVRVDVKVRVGREIGPSVPPVSESLNRRGDERGMMTIRT